VRSDNVGAKVRAKQHERWLVTKLAADGGELDLRTLSDDELVQQIHDDLYDGYKEESIEGVNILLGRGWTPYDVLTEALARDAHRRHRLPDELTRLFPAETQNRPACRRLLHFDLV